MDFNLSSIKKFWQQTGDSVWKLVKDAFRDGKVGGDLLEILLVLIPRGDNPVAVKHFHPISLCNVAYKIITKVLVNRLRPFLNDLVGPMQNSFLPNRGTLDNAFLAQEVVHYMFKSKARKGSLAFKIDLEKAYDRVNQNFL